LKSLFGKDISVAFFTRFTDPARPVLMPVATDGVHEALPHFGLRVPPQNTKFQCWKRDVECTGHETIFTEVNTTGNKLLGLKYVVKFTSGRHEKVRNTYKGNIGANFRESGMFFSGSE